MALVTSDSTPMVRPRGDNSATVYPTARGTLVDSSAGRDRASSVKMARLPLGAVPSFRFRSLFAPVGARRTVLARVVILRWRDAGGCRIDVVVGRAAQRLRRVEGVAAWLDSNRGGTRGRAA